MSAVNADPQARLVRDASLLVRRYELLGRLRELVVPLAAADLFVVDGEQDLIEWLGKGLDQGRQALEDISRSPGPAGDEQLSALDAAVSGPAWEVAEELEARLVQLRREQDERVTTYDKRYLEWNQTAEELKALADAASKAGAVMSVERTQLQTLTALVRLARGAIEEKRYWEADAHLQRLDEEFGGSVREDLLKRVEAARTERSGS